MLLRARSQSPSLFFCVYSLSLIRTSSRLVLYTLKPWFLVVIYEVGTDVPKVL